MINPKHIAAHQHILAYLSSLGAYDIIVRRVILVKQFESWMRHKRDHYCCDVTFTQDYYGTLRTVHRLYWFSCPSEGEKCHPSSCGFGIPRQGTELDPDLWDEWGGRDATVARCIEHIAKPALVAKPPYTPQYQLHQPTPCDKMLCFLQPGLYVRLSEDYRGHYLLKPLDDATPTSQFLFRLEPREWLTFLEYAIQL